jgi:hypothetical protein
MGAMPGPRERTRSFRTLLLMLLVSVAAESQADDPALQGTFVNEQQSVATIETAFDGHKPVQMPADGSTIRWTREDGETFDVNATWDGNRLVQTFKAEDGTRANAFSVGADGRLTMQVTLTSPQLDQPLVYTLPFSRAVQ